MRSVTATALPAKVVSGLLRWVLSWATDRSIVQRATGPDEGTDLRGAAEGGRQKVLTAVGGGVNWLALPASSSAYPTLPAPMFVRLLFFAQYRDLAGTEEMVMEFSEEVCVTDLVRELRARKDGLSHLPAKPLVAVNMDYAPLATTLKNGDLVAFIPPVAER
jgi:molybdopterin converting factor small subunit